MNQIKAVFFDIDNTLYDSTLQVEMVRRNAIKAMIEAGLDIEEDEARDALLDIVNKYGSNYEHHFDDLLKKFGKENNPRIIAAGIVAYHATKIAYLVPYSDTVHTLLELRDRGYKLGVITEGRPVKQWEKLIRLGLQHFFHAVVISEEVQRQKPDVEMFRIAAKRIGVKPQEAVMVGDRLDKDIQGAKEAGMTTIQVMKGKYSTKAPEKEMQEPDYVVPSLKKILDILK
jgi:putative hydrolase of the HAD superfamily